MPQRRFTFAQCFEILCLDRPKISGKTQQEVNRKLLIWKDTVLKSAYRAKAKETHPDHQADGDTAAAEERFKDVRDAYDQLRVDLKIQLRKPKPPPPETHSEATECLKCGKPRTPEGANYCYDCGNAYNVEGLEARLLARGISAQTVAHAKMDGTYDRMKKMGAFSDELHQEIELLFHRERLGLVGRYSGWRGGGLV